MTSVQRRSNLAILLVAAALLTVAGSCDGDNGAGRSPAAVDGPPAAQATATPRASPAPVPVTGLAATLPIIDLHFHPVGWDVPGLVKLFDQLGVARAGNGTGSSDSITLGYAQPYAGRVIPFAGEGTLRRFFTEGERTWNLQSPAVLDYLEELEADLRAGRFKAIGELYANNRITGGGSQFPADSPLMQRLWALSANYQVPLSVHMDATDESVAEMERLLASDRRGIWIWAHAGTYADTPLLRRLFQAHPNLYCELSARVPTGLPGGPPRGLLPILDQVSIRGEDERLRPVWVELLEEFPDRYVIGTDAGQRTLATYTDIIGIWRQILMQLSPAAAANLAHRNAERLLRLSP